MYCFNGINNQLFISMTHTHKMCTELEQLAVSHVTWIGQSSPGHHQELDWKQERQMLSLPARLQWICPLLMIICLDMWHDHPGKFVLTLLNVLTLCCQNCLLWLVIQDAVLRQCTFLLHVLMMQAIRRMDDIVIYEKKPCFKKFSIKILVICKNISYSVSICVLFITSILRWTNVYKLFHSWNILIIWI